VAHSAALAASNEPLSLLESIDHVYQLCQWPSTRPRSLSVVLYTPAKQLPFVSSRDLSMLCALESLLPDCSPYSFHIVGHLSVRAATSMTNSISSQVININAQSDKRGKRRLDGMTRYMIANPGRHIELIDVLNTCFEDRLHPPLIVFTFPPRQSSWLLR
jgi:hypothetical protein